MPPLLKEYSSENWHTATVAGYLCRKAVCSFRGRVIEAWFSPDIPINNGPWKFGGLPGLILKLYDIDRLKVFECTAIEIFQQAYPVKKHEFTQYVETSRDKYRKLVREMYKDFAKSTGLPFPPGYEGKFGTGTINQPYDLLEIE